MKSAKVAWFNTSHSREFHRRSYCSSCMAQTRVYSVFGAMWLVNLAQLPRMIWRVSLGALGTKGKRGKECSIQPRSSLYVTFRAHYKTLSVDVSFSCNLWLQIPDLTFDQHFSMGFKNREQEAGRRIDPLYLRRKSQDLRAQWILSIIGLNPRTLCLSSSFRTPVMS